MQYPFFVFCDNEDAPSTGSISKIYFFGPVGICFSVATKPESQWRQWTLEPLRNVSDPAQIRFYSLICTGVNSKYSCRYRGCIMVVFNFNIMRFQHRKRVCCKIGCKWTDHYTIKWASCKMWSVNTESYLFLNKASIYQNITDLPITFHIKDYGNQSSVGVNCNHTNIRSSQLFVPYVQINISHL